MDKFREMLSNLGHMVLGGIALLLIGGFLFFVGKIMLFGPDGPPRLSNDLPQEVESVQIDSDPPAPAEEFEPSNEWSCFWAPTMNENWHDDVLCTNGADTERPSLLTDWDFITQADMVEEAARYEAYLNGQ